MDHKNDYQVMNGTSYKSTTSKFVVAILEACRSCGDRVILDYGDTITGESWGETNDVTGTIQRSTGVIKIPILVHNTRSTGGCGILDNCIVAIHTSKGKTSLYKHPTYKPYPQSN